VLCTSLSILHGWKASRLVHGGRYGVGLSVKVGLGLRGLCLYWGKARLVTSWSRPGPVVVRKPLAMVNLSVLPSPLAILPPPSSRFLPLALYCLFSWHLTAYLPLGWHPTTTHQLAPYCYSPAGTLLPCGSARLSILSDRCAPPRLRPAMVLHCLRGCRQRFD